MRKTLTVISSILIAFLIIKMSGELNFMPKYETNTTFQPEKLYDSRYFCYNIQRDVYRSQELIPLVFNSNNETAYRSVKDSLNMNTLSKKYSNLSEFITITRDALLSRLFKYALPMIPIIFHNPPFKDTVRPSCDGLWVEFGVYTGSYITSVANWKRKFCGEKSDPVYGFDTFTGLPTDWRPGYGKGTFKLMNGTLPQTPSNTVLIKGLFIDTLPLYLHRMDEMSGCHTPVAFVHIDCDIYDGARDVLFMLSNRLVPGSILVFDELFNYPFYEKHEIRALYELLQATNLHLIPLGSGVQININATHDIHPQSFGFIVTDKRNDS